jgi:hypothetical protein
VNDRFVGIIQGDCCFGEQPEFIGWGEASSSDGEHWTVDASGLTDKPLMPAIEDSICVALGDDGVHSGSDCDSLELTFSGDSFVPARALGAGGMYLVAGSRGLLSSADGMRWDRAIWSEPELVVGSGE